MSHPSTATTNPELNQHYDNFLVNALLNLAIRGLSNVLRDQFYDLNNTITQSNATTHERFLGLKRDMTVMRSRLPEIEICKDKFSDFPKSPFPPPDYKFLIWKFLFALIVPKPSTPSLTCVPVTLRKNPLYLKYTTRWCQEKPPFVTLASKIFS